MRTNWNPFAYISDWGWTCLMYATGLLFVAAVLAGWV